MNFPQFMKSVQHYTAQMPQENLAASLTEIARTLPEERRDWLISVLKKNAGEIAAPEPEPVPGNDGIYEQLEKIRSGEYGLEASLNEEWDEWYSDDEDAFLFEDNDGVLDILSSACAALHRLIDHLEYAEAYRLGEMLCMLDIPVRGDYDTDTLNIFFLEHLELVNISIQDVLLDTLCAAYFSLNGQARTEAIFKIGTRSPFVKWTLEDMIRHAPERMQGIGSFLEEWILYLSASPDRKTAPFLQEAIMLYDEPEYALNIARQSVETHPEVYLQALEMQKDDAGVLSVGLEALQKLHPIYIVRSRIALKTAEAALALGDSEKADYCRTECFRSESTPVNYLRALLNAPDYEKKRAELQEITNSFQKFKPENAMALNQLSDDTLRFMRFLNGELQTAYDDLERRFRRYEPDTLKQGFALTALFLCPLETLPEGCHAMCKFLTESLSFYTDTYRQGTEHIPAADSMELLWQCLCRCREHIMLPDWQNMLAFLKTICTEMTDSVMQQNLRMQYEDCAVLAAAIGEILETMDLGITKNHFMLECKARYPRRTAYLAELRKYGMKDNQH